MSVSLILCLRSKHNHLITTTTTMASQDEKVTAAASAAATKECVSYTKGKVQGYGWETKEVSSQSNDCFFNLWANQFKTIQLKLVVRADDEEEPPKHTVGCTKPYYFVGCTKPVYDPDSKKYKEHYKGPHVVMEKGDHENIGSYVAIVDSQNPKRCFFGQTVGTGYTDRTLVGGICYFDDDGKMDGPMVPFTTGLEEYDYRNGNPSWTNLFLAGDCLCYVWSYRDLYKVNVNGWILQDDQLKARFKGLQYAKRPRSRCDVEANIVDRWLYFLSHSKQEEESPEHYVCLDLKSIRRRYKDSEEIVYDVLTVPSTLDPVEVTRSLTDVPSYDVTMRDGYPAYCVKCGKETYRGGCNISGILIGLGRSLCCNCRIRYSNSEQKWECWNVVKDSTGEPRGCWAELCAPDYSCTKQHMPAEELTLGVARNWGKRPRSQDAQQSIMVNIRRKKAKNETTGS